MTSNVGPMDGDEIVAHTKWARRYSASAGANETGICESCHRPFLFNGHVVMPRTCGRERCMSAVGETPDMRVLHEPPPTTPVVPRTRRAHKTTASYAEPDAAPEPICMCMCHLNAYQREAGFASDATWSESCEHCSQTA